MDLTKYDQIQEALQTGQLSEALDLLVAATREVDKDLRGDVLLLKSKFEYNRNQYEVKGILSDQEFNIQYSKTLLGVQEALERWRKAADAPATAPVTHKKKMLWPVVVTVIVLLAVAAIWYQSNRSPSADPTSEVSSLPIESTNDQELEEKDDQAQHTPAESQPQDSPVKEKTVSKMPENKSAKTEPTPSSAGTEIKQAETKAMNEPASPPATTFEVLLIKNSNMGDAEIYVDGERAMILSHTPVVTSVQVTQKQGMHVFELRGNDTTCKQERLITTDKQRINFNCN